MVTRRDSLKQRIVESQLFGALGPEVLEELVTCTTMRTLGRGEILWTQGDEPDCVAVVLKGRLDVCRTTSEGDRMLLRVLRPPDVVGLSTVAGKPHTADLVAGQELQIASIPGNALRGIFARRPESALLAIEHLGDLLGRLTDEVEELRFQELDERLLRCIQRHARGRREIRFTHDELGQQIGASRSNVSRALKRLERRGLLRCGRRRIEIVGL